MTKTISMRLSVAAVAVFLAGGAWDIAVAQAPNPKPHIHQHAQQGMTCMADGMGGPHHAMSMAHRSNLSTFARTLQEQVEQSKTVDLEMARPAVAEMRRSFDATTQHHQAHMALMAARDSTKSRMMAHMDSAMASVGEHLAALEAEVNGPKPDPAKVIEHTTAILHQCRCAEAPAKPHPHHL